MVVPNSDPSLTQTRTADLKVQKKTNQLERGGFFSFLTNHLLGAFSLSFSFWFSLGLMAGNGTAGYSQVLCIHHQN
jgi:hypothetical protein